MLEKYRDEQPFSYCVVKNAIEKKRTVHAFLIITNQYANALNFAIDFATLLVCDNKEQHQTINKRIYDGNYPDVKIIQPDGLMIKKEQIKELQTEFNAKALESNNRVYIINEADKLNPAASNSLLKFLEEPEPNIIAILLADNSEYLLKTIVSRCQIISLINNKKENKDFLEVLYPSYINNNLKKEDLEVCVTNTLKWWQAYEKRRLQIITQVEKLFKPLFKSKEELDKLFEISIYFYQDILNYLLGLKIKIFTDYFTDYNDIIVDIASKNNLISISNKIEVLINTRKKIRSNINENLLIDKMILEMEEYNA